LSLNWREIDLILSEIPLENSFIRQIHQPDHQSLVFELYNRGKSYKLFFCFAPRLTRLHLLTRRLKNPHSPPRFAGFLRSRIRGGRIVSAAQLGRERIVRIRVARAEEIVLLYARFWGGAANLLATDAQGRILDALYRRPKRDEISGGLFRPEEKMDTRQGAKREYEIRELPGEGSFNEKIERAYFSREDGDAEAQKLSSELKQLEARESRLLANLAKLETRCRGYSGYEQFKRWGDLILSNAHTIRRGDRWLACADFDDPKQTLSIELDPALGPAENAENYYRRHRKARSGLTRLGEEIRSQQQNLKELRSRLERLHRGEALPEKRAPAARGLTRPQQPAAPGLSFISAAYRLLVGRTARENDALLRHHVRGNDIWLHARDYPGAYVFIKTIAGKSVPLEVLLDAGSLALEYSRAKSAGGGDVYYTRVKYLRRVREGKKGLVIPTQEKNLHIKLDPLRIGRLKDGRPQGGRQVRSAGGGGIKS
jgi:predicted ribosome quality control (RQC) complex YloA/Tae2 family protein